LACQAAIGVDGGASINANPAYSGSEGVGHGGVAGVVSPSCVSCILTTACPFFPAATRHQ
jgi:hypothetical protein